MENNLVNASGYAETDFIYDHEFCDEKFYKMIISIERDSGTKDKLPVIISDRLFDVSNSIIGEHVSVCGEFRSYNQKEADKAHVMLYIFALEFYVTDDCCQQNEIILDGHICKAPTYRATPLGREIADMILAVNRTCGKCDYIPCICWGRNAKYASNLNIGDHVSIAGRIQSREYTKKYDDHSEERTAYEVSVSKIKYFEE